MSAHTHGRSAAVFARLGIVALIITGLAFAAPHPAAAQLRSPGFVDSGTMVVATDLVAGDIDPASNEFNGSDIVARVVDDKLVQLDGSSINRYIPDLATRWTTNSDKSVWTFYLRHGVRFHTGRCCLNAEDVKYNIGRTVALQLAGAYLFSRFLDPKNPFKQIKVIDQYTVQFDLGRPQPFLLGALAVDYTSLILDSQALKAHAKKGDYGHTWAQFADAGTGPYVIQRWDHGQQVALARFPDYWGGWSGSHFSKVVVRTVPEDTTRRELIEKGQVDVTYDLTPQDYQALSTNPKVVVSSQYGTEIDYIIMTEAGPLASPAARQGLSYAFPYDALISGFYKGYARRAYGPIESDILGFDRHVFRYTTDTAKAKALLQKAGIGPGTTLTISYEDPYGAAAQLLEAGLAQIGITLKITHLTTEALNNVLFGSEPAGQRPNMMTYAWWPDYNDPFDYAIPLVASSSGPNGPNGGIYRNKQVDSLLNSMQFDKPEDLIRHAHQLMDITSRQDPPAIWTVEPAQVTILARGIQGFVFNPLELRTYNFYLMHR